MKEQQIHHVLVYGTLRDSRPSPKRVINHVVGQMQTNGSYPSVVVDEDKFLYGNEGYKIEGELVPITSDDHIKSMDLIEGLPNLYTKEIVKTVEGNLAYLYQGNSSWRKTNTQIKPDEDGVARWSGRINCYQMFERYGV